MKRYLKRCLAAGILFLTGPLLAQQNVPPRAPAFATAPEIAYDSVPNFLKLPPNLYLGEGIGVARNYLHNAGLPAVSLHVELQPQHIYGQRGDL